MTKKVKIAVATSGGVDSSLAASLLKEQGYEVTAVHLQLVPTSCKASTAAVKKIAQQLKIPLEILDLKTAFAKEVVTYFVDQYRAGVSPNPCILCNPRIKFGHLYRWARSQGFDYLATGHYARTQDGQLLTARDEKKDQTYFLHRLTQEKLNHIKFPLGDLTKKEVKVEAKKRGFLKSVLTESQGACFVGQAGTQQFLQEHLGKKPGPIVNLEGQVIGQHRGLWFYTIGQRHGFTVVSESSSMPPHYVVSKNIDQNELVVGLKKDVFCQEFKLKNLHVISPEQKLPEKLLVKIRHGGKFLPARVEGKKVILEKPAQGVAAGQAAVFYDLKKERCLGGGIIIL